MQPSGEVAQLLTQDIFAIKIRRSGPLLRIHCSTVLPPQAGIDNPTTERLLKTFDNVTPGMLHLPDQPIICHITPLNPLQIRIMELLRLSTAVYTRLAEN
jgi:hypothetical protein